MLPALIPFIGPIIDKLVGLIPDPAKREEARAAAQLQLQQQETEILKLLQESDVAQAKINEVEAASNDCFKSYPRPLAMWIAVLGLAWNIGAVIVTQFFVWFGHPAPQIVLLPEYLTNTLLFGLLGLGAYRTYEKKSGLTS